MRTRSVAAGFAAAACAAGLASLAAAQGTEPAAARVGQAGRAPIYSVDRRFMVSGLTSAENMVLARRLAEQADRVEARTGLPLPMRRDQVMGVMVQSSSAPGAPAMKMQGWDDGRFYQRLVVPSAVRLDEEDLMESLCGLLLNRYAAEYAPAGQRVGTGATVPEWISVGLAQNTQAALRSRNRDWISRELGENRAMPLAQVVKLETLPPGRWREKAYAAAAVEFLFPAGDAQTWTALAKAVGLRQAVDAAWLRQNAPALRDRKPEEAWREHLEKRIRARPAERGSDRGLQIESKLLQTLNFRPRDLAGGVPDEVPEDLFARDLIEHRGQPWALSVAASLALQVQGLELGAPPAMREVLAHYAAFFRQLGVPPAEKTAWWKRSRKDPKKIQPPDDATWLVALNQLWQRAEGAHRRFLEQLQSRKQYVDAFDRPESGGLDDPAADPGDGSRTRWQRYVDEAEDRMNRTTFP